MKAKEIRQLAWNDLAAKQYWPFVGGCFVLYLICGAIAVVGLIGMVVVIAAGILPQTLSGQAPSSLSEILTPQNLALITVGSCVAAVPICYGIGYLCWGLMRLALGSARRELKFEQCLSGWGHGWKMCWTVLVEMTYLQLWVLLLIVPGIIKSFSYAMTLFVQVDHPDWTAGQCITESRRLMDGNKWRYFCLNLSFIGWFLLAMIVTSIPLVNIFGGFAQYLLQPYVLTAQAEFYEQIKREKGSDGL